MLSAALIADLNLDTSSSNPNQFTQLGNQVLLATSSPAPQLWKTDGTTNGTSLLGTFQGDFGVTIAPALSPTLGLFFASQSGIGKELFKTDGTAAGTVLLRDINPGSASSVTTAAGTQAIPPNNLIVIDGVLYFPASDGPTGMELWRSDGTSVGTYLVKDIDPGSGSSSIAYQTRVGNSIYFSAVDTANGLRKLFRTDGTAAGTVLVSSTLQGVRDLKATATGLYFFAYATGSTSQYTLYKLNPTTGVASAASATPLTLPSFSPVGSTGGSNSMAVISETLYFIASDTTNGTELWKSDGATTQMVKDISAGSASSTPLELLAHDGTLFFTALDATHGTSRVLYTSDGTAAGTNFVDVAGNEPAITSTSSSASTMVSYNGLVYFTARDATNSTELWKSDGTGAGTTNVTTTLADKPGSVTELRVVNGAIYFGGTDVSLGVEPFRSDGTAAGTGMIKDLNAVQNLSSTPDLLFTASTGVTYFSATRGVSGRELYKTDGTTVGTVLVKDINPGVASSSPTNFVEVNGVVYFTASDGTHGTELWRTDGSGAGTYLVSDVQLGSNSGTLGPITVWGTTLYFEGSNAPYQTGLYKSDGTAGGTALVKDFSPGGTSMNFIYDIVPYAGSLYVSVGQYQAQRLWKSDGTTAGTAELFAAGTGPTGTTSLTVAGGNLFFVGSDSASNFELWKSGGTAATTAEVKEINSSGSSNPSQLTEFGGKLFFRAYTPATGYELWSSNGTSAGTNIVYDLFPGASPQNALTSPLTSGGGWLYFAANNGTTGNELWRTNGSGNPQLVKDISPGAGSGLLTTPSFAWMDGRLYFAGTDGATNGLELWSSDGTAAGTVLAANIAAGTGSSAPTDFAVLNGRLLFAASDGTRGTELWSYAAPVVNAGAPYAVNEGSTIGLNTSATDPFGQPLTLEWDFNYDGATFSSDATGGTPTFDATLHDGHNTAQNVGLRITDANGGSYITTVPIVINNVAPTLTLGGELFTSTSGYFQPTFQLADPGFEQLQVTAQYGLSTTPISEIVYGYDRKVQLNHYTANDGDYLLTVIVKDGDGEQSSASVMVHTSATKPPGVSTYLNLSGYYIQDGKFHVTQDQVTFGADADLSATDLVVGGFGTARFDHATHAFKSLAIEGGGVAGFANSAGDSVSIGSVSIIPNGMFDVLGNSVVITNQAAAQVSALLAKGYHGGAWNGGGGIVSYTASNQSGRTAVGMATASELLGLAGSHTALWAGQTASADSVLVRYTYSGDATLDGKINVDDYTRIDFNAALGTTGWFNGDFNFDGKINVDDYTIIDFNVGIQGPPLAGALSAVTASGRLTRFGAVQQPPSDEAEAEDESSLVAELLA